MNICRVKPRDVQSLIHLRLTRCQSPEWWCHSSAPALARELLEVSAATAMPRHPSTDSWKCCSYYRWTTVAWRRCSATFYEHDCLIFGIRNVSIFLLDLIQSGFFLVCLFLSLTHDSSYLLTWVSYCCVRTLLRHFAVTDVSPQLHVATENQDTQEWSLRFLLVFFLYFFTVVLLSAFLSVFLFA